VSIRERLDERGGKPAFGRLRRRFFLMFLSPPKAGLLPRSQLRGGRAWRTFDLQAASGFSPR
jgi:hypothetical protein